MISSPNFALFWGKHLISPFLGGTTLPNLGEISQNTHVLSQNVAFLVYTLLGKFSLKKAARGKFLTYSKSVSLEGGLIVSDLRGQQWGNSVYYVCLRVLY